MAHETIHDRECGEQRTCNIRRLPAVIGNVSQALNQDGKHDEVQQGVAAVYRHTSDPFPQVVSFRLEHEPLVRQEGEIDTQAAGYRCRNNVAIPVRHNRIQDRCESGKRGIREQRVPDTYQQIAPKLTGRDVIDKSSDPGQSLQPILHADVPCRGRRLHGQRLFFLNQMIS